MDKPSVGYIGLGAIGTPMCLRLIAAGHPVTVWGRTPERLRPALEAGAAGAASPADLARRVDLLFVCVTDTAAVEAVVFGPDGVWQGAAPGKVLVDSSTIDPLRTREMAGRLRAGTGMGWVDAPVSGGVSGARAGTLAVMAGGEAADVERVAPVMTASFAGRVTHMGPAGAGQATKCCNQMIIAATIGVMAEALNFAAEFGVDAHRVPDALAGGWADSTMLQDHARRMARAEYPPPGTPSAMLKDLTIAAEMGRAVGAPMPVTEVATGLYRRLADADLAYKGQTGPMWLYKQRPL